jgi:hypothetical protein
MLGYGFLFRSEFFFRTTQDLEFFLSREARNCFPEFNISLYDKNSVSDFFFPPPISEKKKCDSNRKRAKKSYKTSKEYKTHELCLKN